MAAPPALKPLWADFEYKAHQVTGVQWMLKRVRGSTPGALGSDYEPAGGILCDEMGLGKTIQVIGLLKNAVKPRQNTLLVAPVAVLGQWNQTATRAGLTVKGPRRGGFGWDYDGPIRPRAAHLHVVGYEFAIHNPTLLSCVAWDRMVVDEAHRLANPDTRNHQILATVEARARWFLTATPIVNAERDIVSLLRILGNGGAGYGHATRSGLTWPPSRSWPAAQAVLSSVVLARSMAQLRAQIPDAPPAPVSHVMHLDFLTEAEADFYRGMSGVIVRRWRAIEADGGTGAAIERLRLFMRLRQLSLHPQVYIGARKRALGKLYSRPDWDGTSTKFAAIQGLVQDQAAAAHHKWLIFCHFHEEMDMLAQQLRACSAVRTVSLYHGGMSAGAKETSVQASRAEPTDNRADVLLVQLQSGGVGLNLQHCDRIVFSGPWWTSALMEQAIGRAVRIGQRAVVQVYHLVLKEEEALNIDRYMHDKAATKGGLCRKVLDAAEQAVFYADLGQPRAAEPVAPSAAALPAIPRAFGAVRGAEDPAPAEDDEDPVALPAN